MSVDTKLYLNPRWELRDIVTVLERTTQKEVTIKHCDGKELLDCFEVFVGKRRIFLIVNSSLPTGSATYMSLGSDDEAIKIFKDVAEVLGGILMENDCDGECEIIEGAMWEEDKLPFFLKCAIIDDGINPDDIDALKKFVTEWKNKHRSN